MRAIGHAGSRCVMLLNDFLTRYDDCIGSELNVDPLGFLVLWSAFGQTIFRNRVSSNANDVRNYTINLFNHWTIRELIDDETAVLSTRLTTRYPRKDDLNFKQACLVYLENLFTFSVMAHRDLPEVTSGGVLGISKAGRRWSESAENPALLFSHEAKAHILARQHVLGVSGRYKTPLLEMGFFDRHLNYSLPGAQPLWQKTSDLVTGTPALKGLANKLKSHLRDLFGQAARERKMPFADLPEGLSLALVKAFASPAVVGAYAGKFWLGVTELNRGAAGALYEAIKPKEVSGRAVLPVQADPVDVFSAALESMTDSEERCKLENIQRLEPFLAELDLLFTLLISQSTQTVEDVAAQWLAMGRDGATLARLARPIEENHAMKQVPSEVGRKRLNRLFRVAARAGVRDQAGDLLAYHKDVMEGRGQSSWIRIRDETQLKLDVPPRRVPSADARPLGTWVHHYYIPQFRNLVNGLSGVAA